MEEETKKRLAIFDELDFDVFSNQDWKDLDKSHSEDVRVIWPDGHETNGIKQHIEDLSNMFVALPDTRIKSHPVAFGSGDWTVTIGVMEGTFTKPMPMGGGKVVQPTGKKLNLQMATIAHWKGEKIFEEYLFWDNAAYLQQLGIS
jgi:predicted ester cyclase